MTTAIAPQQLVEEVKLRRLARLIACDIYELKDVLKMEAVSEQEMAVIINMPAFEQMLKEEQSNWNSTENADDRIQLKSKALVEEFLVEAYARLHDGKESLLHKVALLKEVSRMGRIAVSAEQPQTDKIQVIINLPSAPAVAVTLPVTQAIDTEYEEVEE